MLSFILGTLGFGIGDLSFGLVASRFGLVEFMSLSVQIVYIHFFNDRISAPVGLGGRG